MVQAMTYSDFIRLWKDGGDFVLCHTSGSTGVPKPVMISKADMRASARLTNDFFGISAGSVLSVPLPFDYIAARMMAVRADVAGCRIVTPAPSNTPDFFGGEECLDLLAVVPSQVEALAAVPDAGRRVRNVIVGGAPLSEARRRMLIGAGAHGYLTYGMTETCSHIALADIADDRTVFRAIAGDTRFDVDDRGCLVAELPHLGVGRVTTNDIVTVLSSTEFLWHGRADNVINSAGLKICPEEVEKALVPLLPQGLEFYITGMPDERWGTAVALVYEGEGDGLEQAVRSAAALLPDHRQRPRYFFGVKRFERTSSGKVRRVLPTIEGI